MMMNQLRDDLFADTSRREEVEVYKREVNNNKQTEREDSHGHEQRRSRV